MTAFNPNDDRNEDELEQNMTMSHMVPREEMNRTSLGIEDDIDTGRTGR